MIPKPNAAKARAKKKRDKATADRSVYAAVRARDRACRACGIVGGVLHAHHIRYRSRGGATTPDNLVMVCPECHEAEHAHRLHLTGTADALWVTWMEDR